MQARIGGLLALGLLLLSGCAVSEAPLLQDAETVAPYPLQYDFVTLDANGLIKFKDDGKMDEAIFLRDGKFYRDPGRAERTATLFPLKDHPEFDILRLSEPSNNVYALVQRSGNRIEIRTVDDGAFLPLLPAGTPRNAFGGNNLLKVADEAHLMAAMNIVAAAPRKVLYGLLAVPYNAIPADKEGLAESHKVENPNDAQHRSPFDLYMQGLSAEYGTGGAQVNPALAVEDYRKAAEAGIAGAMIGLARLLDDGRGVASDQAAAKDWYLKAVNLGDNRAMLALGKKFLSGNGVDQDAGRAGFFLRASAASGNIEAMNLLADLLAKGDVFGADRQERLFWLVKAAEAGNREAAGQLAAAIRAGDGTPPNPTLAAKWEKIAKPPFHDAYSGMPGAMFAGFGPHERQIFMTGFLDMLWTLNDRLKAQGLDGNCAEGYAMDNAAGTRDALSDEMDAFAKKYPGSNLSAAAASFVYEHCDPRRNLLLLDFYMLTFGTMKARYPRDSEDTDIFLWGALSAAVEAHIKAEKYDTAKCIDHYFEDDAADDELRDRAQGYDEDIVTNVVMRELDRFCPP